MKHPIADFLARILREAFGGWRAAGGGGGGAGIWWRLGVRVGNWLTAEEGKKLLGAETAYTLRSRRNRALLSLLIGCGLRRAEVTTLWFEDVQLLKGHCVIADLRGKIGHIRTIPVPAWVKQSVDSWSLRAGINAGP